MKINPCKTCGRIPDLRIGGWYMAKLKCCTVSVSTTSGEEAIAQAICMTDWNVLNPLTERNQNGNA